MRWSRWGLAVIVAVGVVLVTGWALLSDVGDKGLERASWVAAILGALTICVAVISWAFQNGRAHCLLTTGGYLGEPPRLVGAYVARPEYTTRIVAALNADGVRSVALVGPGGVGKSTLGAAVGQRGKVRRRFRTVTWLDADSGIEPIALIAQLARRLGVDSPAYTTISEGRDALASLLAARRMLIVLDNVSSRGVLDAFLGLAPRCKVMFTTRSRELAGVVDAYSVSVNELSEVQAMAVLSRWTGVAVDELPEQAPVIIERLGNLALGVAMAGAMVAQGRRWTDVLELVERDLRRVTAEFDPGYGYSTLLAAIEVGVDDVSEERRHRYLELAVFAGRGPFSRTAVEALWSGHGMVAADVGDLLAELTGRSLLLTTSEDWYIAHDLQYEVLVQRVGLDRLRIIHDLLLERYRLLHFPVWADAAADPYLGANLAWHLGQARRHDELASLLVDVRWMRTRLSTTGLPELITDYNRAYTEHAVLVRRALLMSARVLTEDPRQLSSQLAGRLLGHPDPGIHAWAASLPRPDDGVWLVPLTPALRPVTSPLEQVLLGHTQSVEAVFVSRDGKRVISGSQDGTVRVWDLNTGRETASITVSRRPSKLKIRAFALKPDGRHIICARFKRTLRVWDLETGQSRPLGGLLGLMHSIALTPDGRQAIFALGTQLHVWDLDNDRQLSTFDGHTSWAHAVTVTPDGHLAVSGGADATVRVWELRSGRELACLTGHENAVHTIAVTPDGRHALSGSGDGTVRIWDLKTMTEVAPYEGKGPVMAAAVTPDPNRLVLASDHELFVWDIETTGEATSLRRIATWDESIPNDIVVTPDGEYAIAGFHNGQILVWALNRNVDAAVPEAPFNSSLAVTPDGRFAVTGGGGRLQVTDLDTGASREISTTKGKHPKPGADWSLVLTRDGRKVMFGSKNEVHIRELETNRQIARLVGHSTKVRAVAVTPNGTRVISSGDHRINVWDLGTGRQAAIDDERDTWSLAVTADGRHLVTGANDGTLWVRNLDTLEAVANVHAHSGRVWSVTITPDNKHIISGGEDGTVRVWTPDLGRQTILLKGHIGTVRALTCTPDSRFVISNGNDRTVRVWDLDNGRQVARWDADKIIQQCAIPDRRPDHIVIAELRGGVHVLHLRTGRSAARGRTPDTPGRSARTARTDPPR